MHPPFAVLKLPAFFKATYVRKLRTLRVSSGSCFVEAIVVSLEGKAGEVVVIEFHVSIGKRRAYRSYPIVIGNGRRIYVNNGRDIVLVFKAKCLFQES